MKRIETSNDTRLHGLVWSGLVQTKQYVHVQLSGDIADIEPTSVSHISKEKERKNQQITDNKY